MDPILGGVLTIAVMLLFTAIGVPVGISMAAVGFGGMIIFSGMPFAMGTLMTLPYSIGSQYAFIVVPMFILMGSLAAKAGITAELYTAAYRLFSAVRGSLYYATVLASAAFGAVSGSTVVASAVFTRMALPEMLRFGYRGSIAAGCIAAAGTFAALIPPSISMVIYGILTGESIGSLLMAGLLPGIVTAIAYGIGIWVMLRIRPEWAPQSVKRFTAPEILTSFRGLWPAMILVMIVLGGIYSGVMPPSAAGTIGAAGALAIGIFRRRLTTASFWDALRQSVSVTSVLFLIIIGGMLFTRLLLMMGFVDSLTELVTDAGIHPVVFIIAVTLIYLVLGCFVDTVSMMVMTVPFLYPIVISLDMNPIWFGVIVIKLIEISAITPPVGLNLYAVLGSAEKRVSAAQLFAGVLPFLIIEMVVLAILFLVPELSLWLPELMIG
ncbi:TRAP transporter large permease [Oceanibacterium hippocampi]|uniref:TRAP transporter large permease protein n=1 Tax=Oceanibacterium hippocampi TaxID=745714 RepID=A0A1Y5TVI6_9PROT|nr:TRAP transporter large permease [Oceanibacterium hippocampi]SLN71169.1 Sialic acid TRAP transporter permease protein SiaT [Oceanibacterium hippocampi]